MYLDLLMLINFLVDYLLLLGTNRLSGFPSDHRRLLVASLVGALYCGGCFLPGFSFLAGIHWRLAVLLLMTVIAFGWSRSLWKRSGVFLILSMALGGMALQAGSGKATALFISMACLWCLCILAFGGRIGGKEYVPLEIMRGDRRVRLTALRDTGNTLRDPISGENVLIIGQKDAQILTGLTARQLRAPMETISEGSVAGLRLIPYHTVGQEGGLLLAMRIQDVYIGGKRRPSLVAFAPYGLGGEQYQALAGGAL